MRADFPFARSLIVLRTERTTKKTGHYTKESHYYISSALAERYKPQQWIELIRGHWGGVEIRNHWRRDAIMGEDKSRSRNPNLLANLALIRNTLLRIMSRHFPEQSLPEIREYLHSKPHKCFQILCA
jgi:predicted transposase YbfD/YdcC